MLWTAHQCPGRQIFARNTEYWKQKLDRTVQRDQAALKALTALGWKAKVFWECELLSVKAVKHLTAKFLR